MIRLYPEAILAAEEINGFADALADAQETIGAQKDQLVAESSQIGHVESEILEAEEAVSHGLRKVGGAREAAALSSRFLGNSLKSERDLFNEAVDHETSCERIQGDLATCENKSKLRWDVINNSFSENSEVCDYLFWCRDETTQLRQQLRKSESARADHCNVYRTEEKCASELRERIGCNRASEHAYGRKEEAISVDIRALEAKVEYLSGLSRSYGAALEMHESVWSDKRTLETEFREATVACDNLGRKLSTERRAALKEMSLQASLTKSVASLEAMLKTDKEDIIQLKFVIAAVGRTKLQLQRDLLQYRFGLRAACAKNKLTRAAATTRVSYAHKSLEALHARGNAIQHENMKLVEETIALQSAVAELNSQAMQNQMNGVLEQYTELARSAVAAAALFESEKTRRRCPFRSK